MNGIPTLVEKTCINCKQTKNIKLFRNNRNQCLCCYSEYLRKYREVKRAERLVRPKILKLEKTCVACQQVKRVELFPKTKRRVCLECKFIKDKEWRKKKQEHQLLSDIFIEIAGRQVRARKCRKCFQAKELKFFKQLNQTCYDCKRKTKAEVLERKMNKEREEMTAIYKTCIRCKITKKVGEGITRKKNPYCKECSNEMNRAKYLKNGGKEKFRLKRKINPAYNIETKLRTRLRGAINKSGGVKTSKTETLIGCSFEDFRVYLQSKFRDGMTMEKLLSAEIVLDHIIPCSFFDLTDEGEQRRCFNYTNIQPLWKAENNSKYDSYMGMQCRKIPKSIKNINKLTSIVEELNYIS